MVHVSKALIDAHVLHVYMFYMKNESSDLLYFCSLICPFYFLSVALMGRKEV